MIDWKDCIVPIGAGAIQPSPPPTCKARMLRKCSNCANRTCRIRGVVVDWTHCGEWREGGEVERR